MKKESGCNMHSANAALTRSITIFMAVVAYMAAAPMSESAVAPDPGFSGDGRLEYPGLVAYSRSHLAVQDDQKILVVGGGVLGGIPDECDGSLSKPFRIIAELNNWKGGDLSRFKVSVAPITGRPFDAYVCVVTPGGQILSIQSGNRIVPGLRALAQNVHALPGGYSGTLLEVSIPTGLKGHYRIIGGVCNTGVKVRTTGDVFQYDVVDLVLN